MAAASFPKQLAAALLGHDDGWVPTNHWRRVPGYDPGRNLEQLWRCNDQFQWRAPAEAKVDEAGLPVPREGEVFKR